MRFRGDALKEIKGDNGSAEIYAYSATNDEFRNMVIAINDRIKNEYYLFKQDTLKEWMYISTLFAHTSAKDRLM
jgi:hypothetical protein